MSITNVRLSPRCVYCTAGTAVAMNTLVGGSSITDATASFNMVGAPQSSRAVGEGELSFECAACCPDQQNVSRNGTLATWDQLRPPCFPRTGTLCWYRGPSRFRHHRLRAAGACGSRPTCLSCRCDAWLGDLFSLANIGRNRRTLNNSLFHFEGVSTTLVTAACK